MLQSEIKHGAGMCKTAPYKAWINMKSSCNCPTNPGYPYIGAKGIGYDASWEDFNTFWLQMRATYQEGARLVRVNTNKWFSEKNCRWQVKGGLSFKKHNVPSGVKGVVRFDDNRNYCYWMVRFTAEDGKRVSQLYSINKLGEGMAYLQALLFFRNLNNNKKSKTAN